MTDRDLFGDRRKFSKRKRGSGIPDRIWIFEQIFTLSLHNAYYAVFFGVLFSRVITSVNQANWGPFEDFKTFS